MSNHPAPKQPYSHKDSNSNVSSVVPLRKECGIGVKKNKVSTIVKDPDP